MKSKFIVGKLAETNINKSITVSNATNATNTSSNPGTVNSSSTSLSIPTEASTKLDVTVTSVNTKLNEDNHYNQYIHQKFLENDIDKNLCKKLETLFFFLFCFSFALKLNLLEIFFSKKKLITKLLLFVFFIYFFVY